MAHAVYLAWSFYVKATSVDRRSRASSPGQSSLYCLSYFVQAYDKDDLLWPPRDSSHTIAISVNVYDYAVFRDGVCTRQINICREGSDVHLYLLFVTFH